MSRITSNPTQVKKIRLGLQKSDSNIKNREVYQIQFLTIRSYFWCFKAIDELLLKPCLNVTKVKNTKMS